MKHTKECDEARKKAHKKCNEVKAQRCSAENEYGYQCEYSEEHDGWHWAWMNRRHWKNDWSRIR